MINYTAVVPKKYSPEGPYRNQLLRLAARMMLLTSMTDERRTKRHFIEISDDTWRSMFGGQSSAIKRAAIETGLLEINDRYSVGRFSKSYRLSLPFSNGCFQAVELSRKTREQKTTQRRVCVDEVGSKLHRMFDEFVPPSDVKTKDPWSRFALNRLVAQDFYSTRCLFNRFHSNFTGLPKLIRQQLTLKSGHPLASLDVKNIQPLLIGIGTDQRSIPICHTLNHYLRLCEAGRIYEFVLGRLQAGEARTYQITSWSRQEVFEVDPSEWNRNQVKRAFLICVFDRVEAMQQNPVYQVLRKHFPAVADYIVHAKRNGHQGLAQECQRLESQIMIDGVAGSMLVAFPESPILTVHDEIIVPVDRLGDVKRLIEREFAQFGVRPSVEQKLFKEPA